MPAVAAVWWISAIALWQRTIWPACIVAAVMIAALVLLRSYGQAVLTAGAALAAAAAAAYRLARVPATVAGPVTAEVISVRALDVHTAARTPHQQRPQPLLASVHLPDNPATYPLFFPEPPGGVRPGDWISAVVSSTPAARPSLAGLSLNAHGVTVTGSRWSLVNYAVDRLTAATAGFSPGVRGLLGGMIVGDQHLQEADDRAAFLAAGLSHLSAVSGSNVAIVLGAVVVCAELAGLSPRCRVGLSAVALLGFVAMVGPDPSVLRAGTMGALSVAAMAGYRRMDTFHGLCLATLVLLLVDPDLSVSFGFALSVSATAGIVLLVPVLTHALALGPLGRLPAAVLKAVALAMAAEIATAPLIALMTGHITAYSVVANVAVALAVPPVTILGVVAVCAAMIFPSPAVAHWILLPAAACCRWILFIAHFSAHAPHALLTPPGGTRGPAVVLLAVAWLVYAAVALVARRRGARPPPGP